MTTLPTRSKDTLVATFAAGMQGRLNRFMNFAVGSAMLACAEAQAGLLLWLQARVAQVLKLTRAATSEDDDLHTWTADYFFDALPARAATGPVTFARYTPGNSELLIPLDAIVQSADGLQRFTVYADPAHGAYQAERGGYVLAANTAAVSVPVIAETPGLSGNVAADTISLVGGSGVPGIVAVTNPVAFTNGLAAESDDAHRARFRAYILGLSKATQDAIGSAIYNLQQGLQYTIYDEPGHVLVAIDDGSGAPPQSLVQRAAAAVEAVRAAGVRVAVVGASRLAAAVSLVVTVDPGFDPVVTASRVRTALSAYIAGLKLGQPLRYTVLEHIAYTVPGVSNVTGTQLNGGVADLIPGRLATVRPAGIAVAFAD